MQFFLEVLLTSWIDPFLWFKSMSMLGVRKSKKHCILVFLGHCCLLDAKSIIEIYWKNSVISECLVTVLLLYSIWATWFLFKGTLHEKAIYILGFHCILISVELGIIEGYVLLFGKEFDQALNNSLTSAICYVFVKILQAILCYCFFGRKNSVKFFSQKWEKLSLLLMCYIMLSNLYLKKMVNKENLSMALLLETLFLFWYIVSSALSLKGKNKDIGKLKQKADSSLDTKRQIKDIDQLRHDFSANMFVMKNLWYYKDYEKLEQYMDTVFADVDIVKVQFEHPNFPVRIIVSNLMQLADRVGIHFTVWIDVKDFGMTDEHICTVLHYLVLNGFELTLTNHIREAYVQLEVLHNDIGYEIRCKGTCMKEEKERLDNQKQMEVIERIIEKYDGIVEMKKRKSEGKNIYEREVRIIIHSK